MKRHTLAVLAAMTLAWSFAACGEDTSESDDDGTTSSSSTGQGGSQTSSGPGGGATGQCGGPGQACEASCTGTGNSGDCQACAMEMCGAEIDACFADTPGSGCRDCADFLTNDGEDESELCGYDTGCGAGTSCALTLAVVECMCGPVD